MNAVVSEFVSRADPDKLFAVPDYAQDKLMTEYLAYECNRTHMDERFDMRGNVSEHLRIIDWYCGTYADHRKRKLPISAEQASYLNAPLPVLDFARPISVFSYSIIRRELGQHWDLNDARVAREAIYWWSIERAPMGHFQDVLVPSYYVDVLNEVDPHQRWDAYHLNYFLARYHQVHPELHFLNLDHLTDRVALIVHLVFLCAREPHLVRFLPRDSIGRLLAPLPDKPEFCTLDSIIATLPSVSTPGPNDAGPADEEPPTGQYFRIPQSALIAAQKIRESVTNAIAKAGYSLRSGRRVTTTASVKHSAVCYDDLSPPANPVPGISVIGPLQATSGLGQASRLSLTTLKHTAWDVAARNFSMDNPAPVGFSSATISTNDDSDPREINLIHLNAESIPLAFAYLRRSIYSRSYNIGYFFWELTKIPACHHLALKMLDEIWVSSEYNREIYSAYTDIPVINVGMAVEPVTAVTTWDRQQFGLRPSSFVFLTTFDSFSFVERKNPLGVIKAFQKAFPNPLDDVVLVIKTQNRFKVDDPYQLRLWAQILSLCEQDLRLIVINDTMSYPDLMGLKAMCDCYVSLHRSEGWGFGMIEAMQLGLPVIATGYSGNLEFCSADTCYLVDYDLIEPRPAEYIFVERGSQWAEPRLDSAAAAMRDVFNDRGRSQSIAEAGRAFVASAFSISAIARRYGHRLDQIARARGFRSGSASIQSLKTRDPSAASPSVNMTGINSAKEKRAIMAQRA